ncbi:MAG: transporter substrate-binding domain-containing protein [Lamprobacter sp.]|uniref:transporter substrate-binding domain-containing protein n=1 Tax=Lamprobacter sp. TaxID=3100796 RepID=UPI002B25A093|nr:transporter substrate-binding domain-containing protein [Lamprobacter sp.]MEA3641318.1 transporter substrate-binding domain-containing protein [Lamprobacter sp.]
MTGRPRAAAQAFHRLVFALLLLASSLVISLASGSKAWGETPPASAEAIPLSAAQRAWLEAHPDIVLGASDQFAPALIREPDGRLTGIFKDMLDLLNQQLGTDIRLHVSSSWADISEQAIRGQVDGLMAVARLPLWREHFLLTETFIKSQVYIFVNSEETLTGEGVDGLRDQRVGVLRGHRHINGLLSASADALEVIPYDDYQAMAAALLSGAIDRVVADSTFEWWRRKQSLVGIEIAAVWEEGEYEAVLAIRKDWPELVEILNLGLASISSAERAAIYNRWLGSSSDATPASALESLALSDTERAWLQAHPEILLGISDQFQPDVIVGPDGRQSGLVVDLIERLNEPLGGRLKLHVERDWSEVTRKAKAREIDGLASSAPNPVWDQHFLYTDPLYRGFFSLYRRVDDPPLRDREALVGLRVGYLAGMRKIETLLADLPDLTLVPLADHPAMAKALINGEVDVLVGNIDLEWWRRQHSSLAFHPTGILVGSEHPVVMSIRNDWPELVGILNKALRAIPAAERAGIESRWLGASPTQTTAPRMKLSAAARAWLDEHSRIRFAVSRDWAPVDFYDRQDRPAGIAPDYLERIGEMLGMRFEPVPIDDWPQAMDGLQQGRIDLLPAANPTPERERDFLFTEPYLEFPIAIFAPVQTPLIDRLSTLHGQRVIVIEGHTIQHWLQADHPGIQLVPVRDARSAVRALAQGQGEALIGNLFAISQAIAHEQLFQLRVAGETPYSYRLAMAVRPDWQPLLAILEQALAAIPPAEREAIQSRWMRALPPARLDAQLLWQIALGAALVLALILLWNLSLRREIARRRRAEHRLAASEQRYRGMVESARSVLQFYSLDAQGIILDVSAGSRELFGIDDRDMVGKHWGEIAAWSPDTLERIEQGLATCWRGQAPAPVTVHYELDGESRYLLSFALPVKDDRNRVVRIEGLSINLTERLRLEEAVRELESDLHALIEHAPLPMLIADSASARTQLINQRFRSLIGYTLEEIEEIDRWWPLAYPDPDYRRQIASEWQQRVERALATDGLVGPMEAGIQCADGQTRTLLAFAVILSKRYLVMFIDVTEQRATEARLRAAQEKAEAANRAKSEFLANMSHEIRTPMNAILGMQSLCLDGALDDSKRDYLIAAQSAANTLLGLLNDLLDLSKIEAGQLRLDAHPFALSQVLDQLRTLVARSAEEKGLKVVIDCPAEVPKTLYGDALRLSQILLNLANNAVKFTEQGAIHIEARLLERLPADAGSARERVHLEFRVRDTGIGLSEDQSALLFQPFHQADGSITRRYGGTGLGLSICKRLALMMDGAIGVNSQLGVGSTFWFTVWTQCPLPDERPARDKSLSLAKAPPELAGRRLLLVEDHAFNREVARAILERAGIIVCEAEQGVAALAQLREQGCAAFDLVLMDIQMPEMGGLEATERIRALPDGRALPIIGLTAHVRDEDVARARAAGMNAHLGKPFEPARLYGLLAEQLGLELNGSTGNQPEPELESEPERPTETLDLPAIQGLDPAALRMSLGPDVHSWRKFLRLFADNHGGRLARIDAALAAADHALAEREAHSLVGAAGMLGLTEIHTTARTLEDRLRDRPEAGAEIAEAYAQLAERLQPALVAIAAWRAQRAADPTAALQTAAAPVNRDRLVEVLAELQDLAKAYNPLAEALWRQERALLQAGLDPETYRRLDRQIDGYRFPQASVTLAQVRKSLRSVIGENLGKTSV